MNKQGHTNEIVTHSDPIASDVLDVTAERMMKDARGEAWRTRERKDGAHDALRKMIAWCDDERAAAETEQAHHKPGSDGWLRFSARARAMGQAAIHALEIITGDAK